MSSELQTVSEVYSNWNLFNLCEKKQQYESLIASERDKLWSMLNTCGQRELEKMFESPSGIPFVDQHEQIAASCSKTFSNETNALNNMVKTVDELFQKSQSLFQAKLHENHLSFEMHLQQQHVLTDMLLEPYTQLNDQILALSRSRRRPYKRRCLTAIGPTLPGTVFGFGSVVWDKRATTTFGRQFQYLRGHDLATANFQLEMELNFRFANKGEFLHTWKRYHPNACQWRSIQNMTCRKIAREHIYVTPPSFKLDEASNMTSPVTSLPTKENYHLLPTLSSAEHDQIWVGFSYLDLCHFEWSKAAFALWYDYELKLHDGTPIEKKDVEKAVLLLDHLTCGFVSPHNPCQYVIYDPVQHAHLPFQSVDTTSHRLRSASSPPSSTPLPSFRIEPSDQPTTFDSPAITGTLSLVPLSSLSPPTQNPK